MTSACAAKFERGSSGVKGSFAAPRTRKIELQCYPRLDESTSPAIAHQIIGRDRSLKRLSADSEETYTKGSTASRSRLKII